MESHHKRVMNSSIHGNEHGYVIYKPWATNPRIGGHHSNHRKTQENTGIFCFDWFPVCQQGREPGRYQTHRCMEESLIPPPPLETWMVSISPCFFVWTPHAYHASPIADVRKTSKKTYQACFQDRAYLTFIIGPKVRSTARRSAIAPPEPLGRRPRWAPPRSDTNLDSDAGNLQGQLLHKLKFGWEN